MLFFYLKLILKCSFIFKAIQNSVCIIERLAGITFGSTHCTHNEFSFFVNGLLHLNVDRNLQCVRSDMHQADLLNQLNSDVQFTLNSPFRHQVLAWMSWLLTLWRLVAEEG